MSTKKDNELFLEDGSKPNDFTDGLAITAVIFIIVTGIIYHLYTM